MNGVTEYYQLYTHTLPRYFYYYHIVKMIIKQQIS